MRPAWQVSAHVPALHTSPAPHARPQAPQFAASEASAVQVPPQRAAPPEQEAASTSLVPPEQPEPNATTSEATIHPNALRMTPPPGRRAAAATAVAAAACVERAVQRRVSNGPCNGGAFSLPGILIARYPANRRPTHGA
jgi:hypothetical protein